MSAVSTATQTDKKGGDPVKGLLSIDHVTPPVLGGGARRGGRISEGIVEDASFHYNIDRSGGDGGCGHQSVTAQHFACGVRMVYMLSGARYRRTRTQAGQCYTGTKTLDWCCRVVKGCCLLGTV